MNTNVIVNKGETKWRRNIILLIYLFVILYFTFLPFKLRFTFGGFFLPYVVGLIVSFIAAFSFTGTKRFAFAFMYAIVVILNFFFKDNINLGNSLAESFNVLCTAFMACYVLNHKDKTTYRFFTYTFTVITVIYAIRSYTYYLSFPGVMRFAAMSYNIDSALPFFLYGLAPYAFPHAITCLLPAFILGLKVKVQSLSKKTMSAILLVLSFVLIYITQATGAFVVALFAVVASVLVKIGRFRDNMNKLIWVIIIVIPFALSQTIQLAILDQAASFVGEDSHYISKIDEMKQSVTGEGETDGDISYRDNLLELTLSAIIAHPIFGITDRKFGHHNALPDRWALYGLVGFLPLILYFYFQIKYTLRKIPEEHHTFYLIGVAANMLMLLSKDMLTWYQLLCFVVMLPILTIYFGNSYKTIK